MMMVVRIDNDKDGLTDQLDRCPNQAEVINGFMDEDGCPDTDQSGTRTKIKTIKTSAH